MPEAFGIVLSAVWDGIGEMVTTIKTDAILLIPVGLMFAGSVIGLSKGLIGTKRGRRR